MDVDLAAGEHALRSEHFALDGYATPRVRLELAPDAKGTPRSRARADARRSRGNATHVMRRGSTESCLARLP